MNEVIKTLETRRSIRAYKPDMPTEDMLGQIAEAGTYAATGMGKQDPIILVVTNKDIRDRLSAINMNIMKKMNPAINADPFYGAPAVLVVLAEKDFMTHVQDGSLVMGNMMNAAWSLGLGSRWIHRAKETFETPDGKAILKEIGVDPDKYEGIGNLIVGYPEGDIPAAAPRKKDYIVYVK